MFRQKNCGEESSGVSLKQQICPMNINFCFLVLASVFYNQRVFCFFLPDDLGSDQCVRREVVNEDTVVAEEILCGLLKFSPSRDAP